MCCIATLDLSDSIHAKSSTSQFNAGRLASRASSPTSQPPRLMCTNPQARRLSLSLSSALQIEQKLSPQRGDHGNVRLLP